MLMDEFHSTGNAPTAQAREQETPIPLSLVTLPGEQQIPHPAKTAGFGMTFLARGISHDRGVRIYAPPWSSARCAYLSLAGWPLVGRTRERAWPV